MPLHLDSVSRRRFLGSSAVLALSPLLPKTGMAAETETWALLSDTHIAADPTTVSRQGVNMTEHLKRVVAEVLAEKDSLSGVIVNGDCAYSKGLTEDYETFLKLMTPLQEAGLPVHFTLGNHDDRENLGGVLGKIIGKAPLESRRCSVIETPLANWIILDSMRYVNKVEGELGAEQLAFVEKYLKENADKPAILMAHHYPAWLRSEETTGTPPKSVSWLVDSDEFTDLINRSPAAKIYIYGHSHSWMVKDGEKNPHEVNLPATSYVFRPNEPSAWVRATVSANGMSLELRAFDTEHPDHGKKHDLVWR